MTETNVETKRMMMSGKSIMDKLAPEEVLEIPISGFYRKFVEGKTTQGNRKFSGYQYRFIPKSEEDPMISISETSAGGKMLIKQIQAFKEQFPEKGELGHYESIVEFKHVTEIKDRDTGQMKETDFLSVKINPKSLGKRTFTPSSSGFNFEFVDEDNKDDISFQLSHKQ